jgi:hypothetical protein
LPDPYGSLLMRRRYYENRHFKSNSLITSGRLLDLKNLPLLSKNLYGLSPALTTTIM